MGQAVNAIIEDLSDRRGLRQEWEGIDREIRTEIRKVWIDIVETKIRAALAAEDKSEGVKEGNT